MHLKGRGSERDPHVYVFPPAQDGLHQGGRGTLSDDWATIHPRVPLRDHAFCSYLNTKWLSPLGSDYPRQVEFWWTRILFIPISLLLVSGLLLVMLFSHPHPTHLTDFHHHHRHNNDFILDPSSNVYNPWHNSADFPSPYLPALSSSIQQPSSDPVSRTFTYQPFEQDDRLSSRLMFPYNARTSSATPTGSCNTDDARSSRSLNFGPIYPSPSYTLSAAIPSAPQLPLPPPPPPPLPPAPPSHSSSPPPAPSAPPSEPFTSPSPSHSSLDRRSPFQPSPSLPSIHAFRLDTLQSVDPSDDPCPLSLHDLMIPTEEQEYQGHSYHFSLQSVSTSKPPKSIPGSEQKPPSDESSFPKRKGKSKMHTCSLCQKSFPRPSGLRTHMNSHSGDKRKGHFSHFLSHPDEYSYQLTSVLSPLVPSHLLSALMRSAIFGPMDFIHHLLKLQSSLPL